MSFATVTVSFTVGACAGMYVAQEYNVPSVRWWLQETRSALTRWERRMRKEKEEQRQRQLQEQRTGEDVTEQRS